MATNVLGPLDGHGKFLKILLVFECLSKAKFDQFSLTEDCFSMMGFFLAVYLILHMVHVSALNFHGSFSQIVDEECFMLTIHSIISVVGLAVPELTGMLEL